MAAQPLLILTNQPEMLYSYQGCFRKGKRMKKVSISLLILIAGVCRSVIALPPAAAGYGLHV